jgi:hypothetical protein
MATRKATEREQAHMRRIGEIKRQSHADALAAHLARPISERVLRSIAWSIRERADWRWEEFGEGPKPLWNRARRLGLLRD